MEAHPGVYKPVLILVYYCCAKLRQSLGRVSRIMAERQACHVKHVGFPAISRSGHGNYQLSTWYPFGTSCRRAYRDLEGHRIDAEGYPNRTRPAGAYS